MRHYETEKRLRVFPMLLVLMIALAATLVIGNLRAEAHIGEEIPQVGGTGHSMSSNLIRTSEPVVYMVEAGLLPV